MELKQEVLRYSKLNGYPIDSYYDLKCKCGSISFNLYSDDEEGGAFTICESCGSETDIENSKKFIENYYHNICNCDQPTFKIGIGQSIDNNTNSVAWTYVGASCPNCGLSGVYVDWKES